jgi:hypothetical protein
LPKAEDIYRIIQDMHGKPKAYMNEAAPHSDVGAGFFIYGSDVASMTFFAPIPNHSLAVSSVVSSR